MLRKDLPVIKFVLFAVCLSFGENMLGEWKCKQKSLTYPIAS